MSISIEDVEKIIREDIKGKYGTLVEFEISSAKYYDSSKYWFVKGRFEYKITNKTLVVYFDYSVQDDKRISTRDFRPL